MMLRTGASRAISAKNNSTSAKYVSRDVDGYYDLDQYGDWSSYPDYGEVWVPRGVAVDWAPYHVGHWVYVAPWGWTWVDEEPWGFAPFHYGRWAYIGTRWGWVPGPLVVRPVYAPALVAFVGGSGGGFGFSVAFGGGFAGVAWFPLGPRDVYVPGYRCSPQYVQNVNITNTRVINVTQVTNVYNNRNTTVVNYTYARNTAAVTAVSRETFVGARSVGGASVRVTSEQIQQAHVVESSPIAPTRASYVSATARVSTARPAVPFAQRAVVARLNPAAPVDRRAPVPSNVNRGAAQQQGFQQFTPRGGNNNVQPTPPPTGGNNNRGNSISTNENPQVNQPSTPRGGNNNVPPPQGGNPPPPAAQGNNNTAPPQSRDGFRSFQPPDSEQWQRRRQREQQQQDQHDHQHNRQRIYALYADTADYTTAAKPGSPGGEVRATTKSAR